jgi:anaerobic magnesium-protoporphyrin IX monomethyl ester cyclase
MSKRVILLYPRHITGWQAQPRVEMPMGLLCIATPISRAGYQVKIIDQRLEPNWHSILRQELSQDPICIGISSMTGSQLKYALEISKIAKEYGNAPVIWGGVHPTILPEQTLDNEYIDIVVQGEGEETFLELVQALEGRRPLNTVKGIWYKENGQSTYTGARPFLDLNQQPSLCYHLVDLEKYLRFISGVGHLNFFTSRGCPYPCTFCFNTPYNRRVWRAMSPGLAIQRITDFVRRYNVKGITFIDNNFFTDMDRGRRILKGLIEEDLDIVISKISIRVDALVDMSDDDLALVERAGCRRLTLAVESGSERIRAMLKKPTDVPALLDLNRRLRKSPMVPHYLFMMGLPMETREDLSESVLLALRLSKENRKAQFFFNIYIPYPGTELFNMAVKDGLRIPQRIEDWIGVSYRNVTLNAPWLSKEMRNTIEMVDFCSFFVGKGHFRKPYERTNPLVVLLSNIYAPLAKKRVARLFYKFPVEVALAKSLRVYGKQF